MRELEQVRVFCGIDWASDHHDIAIVDESGALKARARIDDSVEGLNGLLRMLAEHGDTAEAPIPVAIESSHGLLVAALRATGRPVYAINPMAAARYRERRTVARKKSDHLDALVLAKILRTDADAHRQLPADSELVQAVAVLARAQQNAVWDRTQAGNKLTSHPRPAAGPAEEGWPQEHDRRRAYGTLPCGCSPQLATARARKTLGSSSRPFGWRRPSARPR